MNLSPQEVAFYTVVRQINMIRSHAGALCENYKVVSFNEPSDVYVVNTCTVTNLETESPGRLSVRHIAPIQMLLLQL